MRLQPHQLAADLLQKKSGVPPEERVLPPRIPKKKRNNEESVAQRAVMNWWAHVHRLFGLPECVLHSVPNGGFRSVVTASIMKAEGQKRGVFDLKLNVARGPYHGLWLEMKARDGVLSPHQKEFQKAMEEQGYQCDVAWSSFEAINIVTGYLGGIAHQPTPHSGH